MFSKKYFQGINLMETVKSVHSVTVCDVNISAQ